MPMMHSHCFSFQSTLPARGATQSKRSMFGIKVISIHAPREGSDHRQKRRKQQNKISIHAPREGSDLKFRSFRHSSKYFNPRSPRGERRIAYQNDQPDIFISIHAPREGSDFASPSAIIFSANFNPRSPRGERHCDCGLWLARGWISIHAPREGSDAEQPGSAAAEQDFNPRSPRGERLPFLCSAVNVERFQSTLPARGATGWLSYDYWRFRISIHAPREGSDSDQSSSISTIWYFNPRSPRGERLHLSQGRYA